MRVETRVKFKYHDSMSKDKRKNSDKRKFVLANLPVMDGREIRMTKARSAYDRKGIHGRGDSIDVSKEIKRLEKEGKIKRERVYHSSYIKRTKLVKK